MFRANYKKPQLGGNTVRLASEADAHQICEVVRASIEQLCLPDHKGDPKVLSRWLANKTPENVMRWLLSPGNINLVSVDRSVILGAGCVTTGGAVVLNYVSPSARFCGVSSRILAALEAIAKKLHNERCALDSTVTAHDFYRARGYCDFGNAGKKFGLTTFPMIKAL